MLDRVRAALDTSRVERIFTVTGPHAPLTAARADSPVIHAPGDGYVADLQYALSKGVARPVLTVAADLPLLDDNAVNQFIALADGQSLTAAVPVGRAAALGFSFDTTTRHRGTRIRPAGLNIVGVESDRFWVTRDYRFAANVNHPEDLMAAEWLLAGP